MIKTVGHLLTQDGMPDVLRAVESLYSVCDKILVVDGGSTDGTLEFLKGRKDMYNLVILTRSFDTMQKQRQFCLDKTPKNNWVVSLDQDESFSPNLRRELPKIIKSITLKELTAPRKFPFVIMIPHFTLIEDVKHYSVKDHLSVGNRIFFYDRDLEYRNPYHCEPAYPGVEGKVDGIATTDKSCCIFHFAWLDPKRMKKRQNKQFQNYSSEEWDRSKKIVELLPDGVSI